MLSKKCNFWAVTLISALALLSSSPPGAVQANPAVSTQFLELVEAEQLNKQVVQLEEEGNYSEAITLAKRSLAIYEQVLGKDHLGVASSLNNLAMLYERQENYTQAEPILQRALAIYDAVFGQRQPTKLIPILIHLARFYHAQENYTQAERFYRRILAIGEKLEQSHPYVVASLGNLSTLYLNQGNIPRAVEFLERANNIEEQKLALLLSDGSESQKRAYVTNLLGATDATVSLHIQAAPTNIQAARLAMTTILRRKSRILDVYTNSLQALRSQANKEDRALLDELALVRSKLAALTFAASGSSQSDQFQQTTILTEQEQKLEASISRRSAEFRLQNQPITIESVQKLIPRDAALVEFVLYKPYNFEAIKQRDRFGHRSGNPRYAAYILLSQGEPKWVDLGGTTTINEAVSDFRRTIVTKSGSQIPFKQAARTLDMTLMQPIRKQLGNKRNILLAPDSQLNLIPFAALIDEKSKYLLENYEITYLSSGQDLIRLQVDVPSQQNPVIVANPQFDEPGNFLTMRVAAGSDRSSNSQDSTTLKYSSIEGTTQEAKAISNILRNAKVLTGSQATENAVKQLRAPSILHIATHGFFLEDIPPVQFNNGKSPVINSENPLLRSGLALSGFNLRKSGNEDGVLTALEVAGLNLAGTKLVVLSACETGLGDAINGEGVYGLRRALTIAGAESQLTTLWLVDDFATRDLMTNYYGRLLKNMGRSAALRETQLKMLKNPQYQRPYYLAAFIPSGKWSRLQIKQSF